MGEIVLLGYSSIFTPSSSSSSSTSHHYHSSKPKLKSSLHNLLHSPSKPIFSVLSRSTHLSAAPLDLSRHNSLDHAANLAEEGRLHEFVAIVDSVVASGVEASQLFAGMTMVPVAKGISKNLREGNVEGVVEVLSRVDILGIPPLKLFDGASMDLLKTDCLRIVNRGNLEEMVVLMETLAGFSFCIKELVDPSRIIKICIYKRNPQMAVRFASLFPHEGILVCAIIKKFGKRGDLDSALKAYEVYKQPSDVPNMYIYRAIIDVCGLCNNCMKSRYIYEDILDQKVIPNTYVFNSLMNVNSHDLGYTLHMYKNMQNLGVAADIASYNILLKACSLAGKLDLAQEIYREVKQLESAGLLKLDVFTYCTIIKIFADAKLWQTALDIKEDMLSSGVTPNTFTWSSLISACANAGLVEQAIQLFEEMLLSGCEPNAQCCNILLHACVEACQYDRAFRIFQIWKGNELLDAYREDCNSSDDDITSKEHTSHHDIANMPNLAFNSNHLSFIKKFPFEPSSTTYNILMKACGSDYRRAKDLMDEMKTMGLSPDHISWSILIDIYGSSGNVEGAVLILKKMRIAGIEPDVVAYTTAIKACVESRNLSQAFALFAEMKRCQIKPNLVTYDTLLRARTKYGSLKEVQQCLAIYQEMRKAGYKSNDYYLKQLIEEWCEGVLRDNDESPCQLESYKGTDFGRPHSLLLEKVATHLQNTFESLSIDLQGLTKVEARVVVLAVLRMIKETYTSGHSIKDDMWISLGGNNVDTHPVTQKTEVKDAIFDLLQNELGLEVHITVPKHMANPETYLDLENPANSDSNWTQSCGKHSKMASFPRRPIILQRLKVTRKSLHHWLHKRPILITK